jgi:cytochrome b561/polyisoprenoid-binding protein YceI
MTDTTQDRIIPVASSAPAIDPRQTRYTSVAIALHWLIAIAILFQLASGWWMHEADDEGDAFIFTLFQVHKTAGLTVLALTLARLFWRMTHPVPALPQGMSGFERFAAHGAHAGLYALMVLVPLSGWAMVSVSPTGVPTYFLLLDSLPFAHLPIEVEDNKLAEEWLIFIHMVLAYTMGGLMLAHVAAALKHQLIARDGLINRMKPGSGLPVAFAARPMAAVVAFGFSAALIGGGVMAGRADAPDSAVSTNAQSLGDWQVDGENSSLGFVVQFSGASVGGSFASWSADVTFEPEQLDASRAEIVVQTASVSIGDPYLSPQATGSDGFASEAHPDAVFVSEAFSVNPDGGYLAQGTLTLRGISVPLTLNFIFEETDGVAKVSGSGSVNRLDFGIGQSNAADEGWLKYPVEIVFDLTAQRGQGDIAQGAPKPGS